MTSSHVIEEEVGGCGKEHKKWEEVEKGAVCLSVCLYSVHTQQHLIAQG